MIPSPSNRLSKRGRALPIVVVRCKGASVKVAMVLLLAFMQGVLVNVQSAKIREKERKLTVEN